MIHKFIYRIHNPEVPSSILGLAATKPHTDGVGFFFFPGAILCSFKMILSFVNNTLKL